MVEILAVGYIRLVVESPSVRRVLVEIVVSSPAAFRALVTLREEGVG